MPLGDPVKGFSSFIEERLSYKPWDGDVPLRDDSGNRINASSFPVFIVEMSESGMERQETFENVYVDTGPIQLTLFHSTRANAMTALNAMINLFKKENWGSINLGSSTSVISIFTQSWTCVREPDRLQDGSNYYRGFISFLLEYQGVQD